MAASSALNKTGVKPVKAQRPSVNVVWSNFAIFMLVIYEYIYIYMYVRTYVFMFIYVCVRLYVFVFVCLCMYLSTGWGRTIRQLITSIEPFKGKLNHN